MFFIFRFSFFASFVAACFVAAPLSALDRPEITFPIFQFPADQIPRIDGLIDDWAMVPESYVIGSDQLTETGGRHPTPSPETLDARVRVGWVAGLNRLYFLYEAYDDYWDFSLPGLKNDTFEIMVDGDVSGGPLIDDSHRSFWTAEVVGERRAIPDDRISPEQAHWANHGVHAQNYHIFTPAVDKDWCMAWSSATWIKNLPYANAAQSFTMKPGESGRIALEFWITPFDYAGPEGPARAVESVLEENKIIGLGWIIIDYDDVGSRGNNGFWALSNHRNSFGDASVLPAFRLMPLEPELQKPIEARWTFATTELDRRLVIFKDQSQGEITSWSWDFGDGATSTEQHPTHRYEKPGDYVVILTVEGPAGTSRRSKVWDVQLK